MAREMVKMPNVYGPMHTITDLQEISREIRKQVKKARNRKRLGELHSRQGYLITLSYSPSVQKGLSVSVGRFRKEAKEQYSITARAINRRARQLGLKPNFDVKWG